MLLVVQGFGTLDSCAMNNLLLPFYFKKHTHTHTEKRDVVWKAVLDRRRRRRMGGVYIKRVACVRILYTAQWAA